MLNTHRKGSRWRRTIEEWLEGLGFRVVVRGIGFSGDDITADLGRLRLSIEAKSVAAIDLAGFVDQAERQAPDDLVPVVMVHRKGRASADDGYVVLSGRSFARLVAALDELDGVPADEPVQLTLWGPGS